VRFDAQVCSNTCAKRKSRSPDTDLAYFGTLSPDDTAKEALEECERHDQVYRREKSRYSIRDGGKEISMPT
jgi:hypothetical protein